MEGNVLAISHFRTRVGSPLLLSADATSPARKRSSAPGRGRVWKRDDPEDSPRRAGISGVPKLDTKFSNKGAGTNKVLVVNFEVSHHRAVAAVRLLRAEKGKAFVDLLNETANNSGDNEMGYVERTLGFSTRHLDDRDIRLVTVIVAGTVRWKRYIDYLIMSLCSDEKVFSKMEPLLLQILRIGFFEILKLNVPAYAVVDENVRLAKVALRPGAGNMVNAILRKLLSLKETDSLPLPKVEGDDRAQARALSIIYSHPVWMVRRWIRFLGKEEALKLMNWNNSDPYFSLRVNTANGYTRDDLVNRLEDLQVHYEKSIMDEFVRIREGMQAVLQAGLLKEGICAVQDESAGFVVSVVDPQPGETIMDCCAAPGGKTLFMASRLAGQATRKGGSTRECSAMTWVGELLNQHTFDSNEELSSCSLLIKPDWGARLLADIACYDLHLKAGICEGLSLIFNNDKQIVLTGKIWALDINKGRLRILMEAAKCHNLDDMITDVHGDLRLHAKESTAKYDKVLLDAPCSGLGVLSKRADLRWNRQFEDLEELTCLQDELLDSASLLVKPGGVLIYSTCSIDHEENEKRITAFVQRHPEFTPQGVHGYVPAEFITDECFYSSSPTKHSLDGAFAARLARSMH